MHSHCKALSKSSREIDAQKGVVEVSVSETLLMTMFSSLNRSEREIEREREKERERE